MGTRHPRDPCRFPAVVRSRRVGTTRSVALFSGPGNSGPAPEQCAWKDRAMVVLLPRACRWHDAVDTLAGADTGDPPQSAGTGNPFVSHVSRLGRRRFAAFHDQPLQAADLRRAPDAASGCPNGTDTFAPSSRRVGCPVASHELDMWKYLGTRSGWNWRGPPRDRPEKVSSDVGPHHSTGCCRGHNGAIDAGNAPKTRSFVQYWHACRLHADGFHDPGHTCAAHGTIVRRQG